MGELKDIVRKLSGKRTAKRREIVKTLVQDLGLEFWEHQYGKRRTNIFVDMPRVKTNGLGNLLITSHYDRVWHTPGANDNASAIAVTMGIAKALLERPATIPIRLAFFDEEEKQLKGSLTYVKEKGTEDIAAVLNYELVGEGTVPLWWEVRQQSPEFQQILKQSCREAGKESHFIDYVILNAGDHNSFAYNGVPNSVCLTLGCEEDKELLEEATKLRWEDWKREPEKIHDFNRRVFFRTRTFRNYHRPSDRVKYIHEESLQQALEITMNFIEKYTALQKGKP